MGALNRRESTEDAKLVPTFSPLPIGRGDGQRHGLDPVSFHIKPVFPILGYIDPNFILNTLILVGRLSDRLSCQKSGDYHIHGASHVGSRCRGARVCNASYVIHFIFTV